MTAYLAIVAMVLIFFLLEVRHSDWTEGAIYLPPEAYLYPVGKNRFVIQHRLFWGYRAYIVDEGDTLRRIPGFFRNSWEAEVYVENYKEDR